MKKITSVLAAVLVIGSASVALADDPATDLTADALRRAQIKPVEHHVGCDHDRDDSEPDCFHRIPQCAASGCATGPFSISLRTRNRNSTPSTVYIPRKPSSVNMPFPAETIFE